MTGPEGGWGWERIDAEIAADGLDTAAFSGGLGVEAEEAERFVTVRRALLAGRADRAAGGDGLTESGLRSAGVRVGEIAAYLRVSEAVGERARADRWRGGGMAM